MRNEVKSASGGKKIIFSLLTTSYLLLSTSCFSLELPFWQKKGTAGFPGEYLTTFTANARAAGLANTYTALSNDANGAYWNPAGLVQIYAIETSFLYAPLFLHTNYGSLGFVYPLSDKNIFGIGLVTLQSAEIEKTDNFGYTGDKFRESENVFFITYAQELNSRIDAGINLKIVNQEIANFSTRGVGIDLGFKYYSANGKIYGLNLQNLLPPVLRLCEEKEHFPLNLKFGFAFPYFKNRLFWVTDVTIINLTGENKPFCWSTGMEYKIHRLFSLRAGVSFKELTTGFGLETHNFNFDYALSVHRLGLTHRFSIRYRYGFLPTEEEKRVKEEKEILEKEKKVYQESLKKEREKIAKEQEQFKKEQEIATAFIYTQRYLREKNYSSARKELEKVLSLDPENQEAKNLLTEIDEQQRKELAQKFYFRAEDFYRQKLYLRSLEEVKKSLQYQPNYEKAQILYHLAQGQTYLQEKKYQQAKEEFFAVIKLNPEEKEAVTILRRLQTVLEFYPSDKVIKK